MVLDKHIQILVSASQKKTLLYIQYSSIVIIWYDYMLTFPMEVKSLWTAKAQIPPRSIIIYIALRYPLLANLLYLLAVTNKLENCDMWYKCIGALSVIGRAAVLTVFTLRTAALYDNSRYIRICLSLAALSCVVLDVSHVPGLRCSGSVSNPIVSSLLAIFICVFEVLASGLLLLRATQLYRSDAKPRKGGLMSLIIQQGVFYFCAVFGWQITAVLLNFLWKSKGFTKFMNAFNLPFSCLLTARFLLELRSWDATTLSHTCEPPHDEFEDAIKLQDNPGRQRIAGPSGD